METLDDPTSRARFRELLSRSDLTTTGILFVFRGGRTKPQVVQGIRMWQIPESDTRIGCQLPSSDTGQLGGYVKTGDPLRGKPHCAQPEFRLEAKNDEVLTGKTLSVRGGADLFVSIASMVDAELPTRVEGS
jgi:hypothetical protein